MSQAAADELTEEANTLFRAEKFSDAIVRFERATQLFPSHPLAWKGLGNALLCIGRPHEAARAFDRAIGLRPDSATALWGGAVAHADVGNKVVAQNYLRRVLALQPTWIEMARNVPQLAAFLRISTRTMDLLRAAFGAFSAKAYRHASDDASAIEVGRIANLPAFGQWTYVTVGMSNTGWTAADKPRVELILASMVDADACGQILANLAFHLTGTGFFPDAGVMVRDVVGGLNAGDLSRRLPHVYLAKPRGWNVHLPLDVGPPVITLVQVIPVSENEYQTWRRGVAGFEASLSARKVEVADLRRPG
jgi:hypothetical protein